MEHKQRAKMPASQRAKQFMPFAAVKGLEKAIAEQKRLLNYVDQIELGEEQIHLINKKLTQIKKGNLISVRFYSEGRYRTLQGEVEQISSAQRTIELKHVNIPFESIFEIKHLPKQRK